LNARNFGKTHIFQEGGNGLPENATSLEDLEKKGR